MNWKDVSSFARGEKDRTPISWELRFGDFRMSLSHHIDSPGEWVLKCPPMFTHLTVGKIGDDVGSLKLSSVNLIRLALESSLRELNESSQ